MEEALGRGIRVRNYKCFREFGGFDDIFPVNLIVGRNNAGKSSLLQLVKWAADRQGGHPLRHIAAGSSAKIVEVACEAVLTETDLRPVFPTGPWEGQDRGHHLHRPGPEFVGKRLSWQLNGSQDGPELELVGEPLLESQPPPDPKAFRTIALRLGVPLRGKRFSHLKAERDITPEKAGDARLQPNGTGATACFQAFLNEADRPEELVREVLEDLNWVFAPEACFDDITVQFHKSSGLWEIYLVESSQGKGRVALSQTGSGVKTVLLVFAMIRFLPQLEGRELGDFVFAFEELENNLHPALLRRLLSRLRGLSKEDGCVLFLTTHSSVAIDSFSSDPLAQIVHVSTEGRSARTQAVLTYPQASGVLRDLDVRASDLLQCNGLVWVEGPSDRIYVNRWISEWSEGELREGTHYQCVFYGGRLLAALSAACPDEEVSEIQILHVNRNAALIMDSDRGGPEEELNETKRRILGELHAIGGIAWVTKGREIENYLPVNALKALYPDSSIEPHPFQPLAAVLDRAREGEGRRLLRSKTQFAARSSTHITREDLAATLDLEERLTELCDAIRDWNGLRSDPGQAIE